MRQAAFIISVFIMLSAFQSSGQFKSKEEIELGNRLKSLYPDDETCAITSSEKYSFGIGKNDTVNALKIVEEEIVGLKDRSGLTIVESYDTFSDIEFIRTFNKSGKKYVPDSYKTITDKPYFSSDIFDDDNRYKSFSFYFASLGEQSKYELRKRVNDVKYLTLVFFHDRYPVEEKTIEFEVPDWFQVEFKEFNFNGFEIKKDVKRDDKKKVTIYTYSLSHCVAMKSEEDAPPATFSWPHIVVVPKQFTNKAGRTTNIFSNTDDLYAWYAYLTGKMKNNKDALKAQVTKLTEGKTTDVEKIKAIYYWVQDNIRYIAFEGGLAGFIPEACDKVYKSKYGDCKGMANLLANMLQIAGYDARLTWIGTNSIPYDYTLPSLVVDNHMICALFLKDSIYFLDGTESFIALGDYAHRIQGRPAMIQDGKKYIIKNVPVFAAERNKKEAKRTVTLKGEMLTGKGTTFFNGETKTAILRAYAYEESDKREELVQRIVGGYNKNFNLSNLKTSDITDREKPLKFDYDFEMNNRVTSAGNETYVSIDFNNDFEDLMPDEKRQNDYMLDEKVMRSYVTEFDVPKGYKVKYLPESFSVNKPDYKFDVSYKQSGTKVILTKKLSIDNGMIKKSIFPDWKKDLKQLKKMNAEQIVLIKG